jgi:hypothetical protein
MTKRCIDVLVTFRRIGARGSGAVMVSIEWRNFATDW